MGILGHRKQHNDEFPGFSFFIIYPREDVGEDGNPEISIGANRKKNPGKGFLSLAKGQRKDKPSKTETFKI